MFKKFFAGVVALAVALSAFAFVSLCGCADGEKRALYEIDCEVKGDEVFGREKVSFFNFTDNCFTELKFNLFLNAFREGAKYSPVSAQYDYQAYKWGKSYGNTEIRSVKVGGADSEFSVCGEDMNILSVPLGKELFPDERAAVEIEFYCRLPKVVARTGVNDDTVNLANFYPVLCGIENGEFYECVYYANGDPFFSDPADYRVKLTHAENFTAATSGKRISEKTENGKTVSEYHIERARSFAAVLSEKFSVEKIFCGNTEINYFYYDDEEPQKSLETAKKALSLFSEKWGEYPYSTFSVVKTPFVQGGMEFSALVFISDGLESAAFQEVIAHETAHQWWQTVVGNNEIKHPFIDEGLAEYSVVLFYETYPEYGYTRENLIKSAEQTYKVFCSVYQKIAGTVDTSMLRALPEYSSEYEYVNIAYVKACIMFDYLRQTVGEERFFAGLKRFYDENAFKTATPESLIGAFERAGADSNGFFESFFQGKVII